MLISYTPCLQPYIVIQSSATLYDTWVKLPRSDDRPLSSASSPIVTIRARAEHWTAEAKLMEVPAEAQAKIAKTEAHAEVPAELAILTKEAGQHKISLRLPATSQAKSELRHSAP